MCVCVCVCVCVICMSTFITEKCEKKDLIVNKKLFIFENKQYYFLIYFI